MFEHTKIEFFDNFEDLREKFGYYCDILSEYEISSWDKVDLKVNVCGQFFYIIKN